MDHTPTSQAQDIAHMRRNAQLMKLMHQSANISSTDPLAALKTARVAAEIVDTLSAQGSHQHAAKR